MQLPRIELSSTRLAVEPFGNWFKIKQVLADEDFLYVYHYFRDNFALWKEFVGEVKIGAETIFEPEVIKTDPQIESSDISGEVEP